MTGGQRVAGQRVKVTRCPVGYVVTDPAGKQFLMDVLTHTITCDHKRLTGPIAGELWRATKRR